MHIKEYEIGSNYEQGLCNEYNEYNEYNKYNKEINYGTNFFFISATDRRAWAYLALASVRALKVSI